MLLRLHPLIAQAFVRGECQEILIVDMKVTTSVGVLQQVLHLALEDQMPWILFLLLEFLKNNIRIPILQDYNQTILMIVPVIFLLHTAPHLEVYTSTTKLQMEMHLHCIVIHSQKGLKVVVKSMLTLAFASWSRGTTTVIYHASQCRTCIHIINESSIAEGKTYWTRETGSSCAMKEVELDPNDPKSAECKKQLEDIKGANLCVDASGVVKIAGFGMAKRLNGQSNNLSLKGSPYWMAPEVVIQINPDLGLAVDIWSLGCTIIEMLNGKPPWSGFIIHPSSYVQGSGQNPRYTRNIICRRKGLPQSGVFVGTLQRDHQLISYLSILLVQIYTEEHIGKSASDMVVHCVGQQVPKLRCRI
ncbi:hypothetical protein Pyn_26264 [Prunus yedoensis var. nudiflora]|uniref:Protein kinase domain-containing protein n=1 Tax=Prunus yedoensis var. nudiflora TaxID=2094558 RepID=A0A314USR0_PRUYE|nr:hypothetical protein Pyn_26264 [Prunus yedoensis var. nudiflora]